MNVTELESLALVVATIEAQQKNHPGFEGDTINAVVNSELRKLEREMGESLDDIAERKQS